MGFCPIPRCNCFAVVNTPPETLQMGRSQRAIVQYVNKLFSLSLPVPQRSSRLRNSAVLLDATDDFEKLLDDLDLSEYVSIVVCCGLQQANNLIYCAAASVTRRDSITTHNRNLCHRNNGHVVWT
eukprot:c20748_g1_i8.p1 GENE.c20748_g1_i8~~c20748_g1_i8.p1  ORF type:complete len:125 (+),score=18.77 c20748_g1_i8:390-764(+)